MLFDLLVDEPLSFRMRPRHLDEIAGQQHIIGKDTALYKMIKKGYVPSILFYGFPGTGKTSIAKAIAGTVKTAFISLNATTSGKKDIEDAVEQAKIEGKLILFIDEIHRFNKAQQDYLLPHVERGLITLIGATTENPFHSVNPAIRSRCGQIKELKPLSPADVTIVLKNALNDKERGIGSKRIDVSDEILSIIARSTNGDVRSALNVLDEVVKATDIDKNNLIHIKEETVIECVENKGFSHDSGGDLHYDLLSSLQKSIRGSDVNASLHYLARLLEGGDLVSLCRRLLVIAYEDISIASPDVAVHTLTAIQAVERLGLPEGRIPLSNIVVEQALSPKTNSPYKALDLAIADVRSGNTGEVPKHLRDAHYQNAGKLGNGSNYKYPHDYNNSWVDQEYMPLGMENSIYFSPKHNGKEEYFAKVYEKLNFMRKK